MPLPFALQASAGCPTYADLALSLAAEFGVVDAEVADASLDALAAGLSGVRAAGPVEQIAALGELMAAFEPTEAVADPRVLMLDEVLDRMQGDPALLAVIAVDAARRAGMDVGVVGDGRRHLVAHRGLAEPVAMDPSLRAAPAGGLDAVGDVTWRCSHQVAFAILRDLIECSLRAGAIADAIRAAELRLALPLGAEALDALRRDLAGLRSRLN
jgi:hypothetical protein